jgi:hypothetical protein
MGRAGARPGWRTYPRHGRSAPCRSSACGSPGRCSGAGRLRTRRATGRPGAARAPVGSGGSSLTIQVGCRIIVDRRERPVRGVQCLRHAVAWPAGSCFTEQHRTSRETAPDTPLHRHASRLSGRPGGGPRPGSRTAWIGSVAGSRLRRRPARCSAAAILLRESRRPVRMRASGSPWRPGRSALRESRKPPRCVRWRFPQPDDRRGAHLDGAATAARGPRSPAWSGPRDPCAPRSASSSPPVLGAVGMSASNSEVVSVSSASPSRRRSPAARTSLRRAPADGTRSVSATAFPELPGGHRATRAAGRPVTSAPLTPRAVHVTAA